MTAQELIEALRKMPPSSQISVQVEDQWTGVEQVIWDGEKTVLWDGDHLYPVEVDPNCGIICGKDVKSDPPCNYDFALIRRKTVLGREFGVIEEVWDV